MVAAQLHAALLPQLHFQPCATRPSSLSIQVHFPFPPLTLSPLLPTVRDLLTMAELLGVFSAGAGLVSLSLQLVDSAQKLKLFCDNTKNAPRSLKKLGYQLDTLVLMLQLFDDDKADDTGDAALLRCVESLQEEVEDLQALVRRLEERLRKSRIMGKFAAAFQDQDIERCLSQLERTKTSAILAHQICVR